MGVHVGQEMCALTRNLCASNVEIFEDMLEVGVGRSRTQRSKLIYEYVHLSISVRITGAWGRDTRKLSKKLAFLSIDSLRRAEKTERPVRAEVFDRCSLVRSSRRTKVPVALSRAQPLTGLSLCIEFVGPLDSPCW